MWASGERGVCIYVSGGREVEVAYEEKEEDTYSYKQNGNGLPFALYLCTLSEKYIWLPHQSPHPYL